MDDLKLSMDLRILIVEDAAGTANEIRDLLLRLHCHIAGVADTPIKAIEIAEQIRPDLVLMNIRLQGAMDSIEAAEHIYRRFNIPIVYLSAHTDQATLLHARDSASFGFVFQPVQERDLLVAIEMAIHRHRLEQHLKESEDRLRQAQHITHLGIWDWDIATDRTWWWGEMYTIYGITPEEFTGRGEDYLLFTHPDDRPEQIRNIQESFARAAQRTDLPRASDGSRSNPESNPHQFRIIRPDGSLCWVEGDAVTIVDSHGKPVRMLGVLVDITERKQMTEALLQREEAAQRFSEGLKQLHTLSLELSRADSLDALCRLAVEGGHRNLGFDRLSIWLYKEDRSQLQGTYGIDEKGDIRDEHGETWVVFEPWILEFPDNSVPFNVRYNRPLRNQKGEEVGHGWNVTVVLRDGESKSGVLSVDNFLQGEPLQEFQVELLGLYGSVLGHLCVRKRAEEALRESQEQLLHAQKMESIGRLAGGLAHDFNNLLAIILGYAELVEESLDTQSDLLPNIQNIQSAAIRAKALTHQLLTFARRQVSNLSVLNLNDQIDNMVMMLQPLIGPHIELKVLTRADLGQVKADPGQIEQVIVNLVINARDAMPEGGQITLLTQKVVLPREDFSLTFPVIPGEYVLLAVSDTGTGMTSEVKKHVFEPFFTTKGVGKGSGLGLATCYGIVKQHHGYIWVESEIGRGTTVWILLPRIETVETARLDSAPVYKNLHGTETVLVVEDEPAVRALVVDLLRTHGYTVLEAADGLHALEVFHAHPTPPDLLLTDVMMPRLQGQALARQLQEEAPNLAVLYMSGYSKEAPATEREATSLKPLIQKPFRSRDLLQQIREALNESAP